MTNTSATGGLLVPASTPNPSQDLNLDALFQVAISGITGLAGSLVRPRWQVNPPKSPEASVDWCAIGVVSETPDSSPSIVHQGSLVGQVGEIGKDNLQRHGDIDILVSCYGPNAGKYIGLIKDGFTVPQNMETLKASGIGFVDNGVIRVVPELYNQQWIRRCDILLRFRRQTKREYPVLNILSATPEYKTE